MLQVRVLEMEGKNGGREGGEWEKSGRREGDDLTEGGSEEGETSCMMEMRESSPMQRRLGPPYHQQSQQSLRIFQVQHRPSVEGAAHLPISHSSGVSKPARPNSLHGKAANAAKQRPWAEEAAIPESMGPPHPAIPVS